MKYFLVGLSVLIIILSAGCSDNVDYERIATYQDSDVPELNIDVTDSTKLLVIVPHADDETIAGGLIAFFSERGASIDLLTLCEHTGIRIKELKCSAQKLGIEKLETAGFINNTWEDIMQDKIIFWYDHKDSIKNVISKKITSFEPDYIITYDSEIGGYGHPEHRISAELTEKIFMENCENASFVPRKIFQITLTDELEKYLVSRSEGYELSLALTGSKGLPEPDVAVNITQYWDKKNGAALCHQSQIKILKRFFIVYDEERKEEHIKAFNKEYYRVVQ